MPFKMVNVLLEITLLTTLVTISASYADNVVASSTWGTICYGDLGCFHSFPPGIFPEPPCLIRPKLRLYIPSSDEAVHVYGYDSTVGGEDDETKKSLRDPSKKLIFVSHGFGESGASEWLQAVKNAKTKTYGDNVIIVDWSNGSRGSTLYLGAAANSVLIGRVVARLCLQLVKAYEIPLGKVEFVGFSLGAQVAGFFAKEMFENTGAKIGRITALDCAAPQFESRGIYPSKDHVNFIEAVHTSSGRGLLKGRVGISIDYGHVDYYMNRGMHQPGCGFSVFDIACSHQRAHDYYVDAIVNRDKCLYRGFPCASVRDANRGRCQPVVDTTHFIGQDNVTTQHAILLVKTNKVDPYCIPYSET